jgi:hypothetical protein
MHVLSRGIGTDSSTTLMGYLRYQGVKAIALVPKVRVLARALTGQRLLTVIIRYSPCCKSAGRRANWSFSNTETSLRKGKDEIYCAGQTSADPEDC